MNDCTLNFNKARLKIVWSTVMPRVMIVEDMEDLLENIALDLEWRGYDVVQASNGQVALDLMQVSEDTPDIIVSDIAMPIMDGYQLLEQVHQYDKWRGIPFIFLTAFSAPDSVRLGKSLGVDDYLTKPFEYDDLVIAIENKLKRVKEFEDAAEKKLDGTRHELVNMIAHELRTPLTSMYGGAEMLSYHLEHISDEQTGTLLGIVQAGAKRMNRLVNRIVNMVQIDSGHLDTQIQRLSRTCDFSEVVMAAVSNSSDELLDLRQVHVEVNTPQQFVCVSGIYEFLVMMVEEVIRNAVAFSDVQGTVKVILTKEADHALLMVVDNGSGVAAEHHDKVWERFVQINRDEFEQQGTGLGLYLTKQVIEKHGGEIKFESAIGRGTTVIMKMPLATGEDYCG